MIKKSVFLFFLAFVVSSLAAQQSKEEIEKVVKSHQPLLGGAIPGNIADRLGVTHVGGKYYLTTEPFLIEGSKKMQELGYSTMKYFISKPNSKGELPGYGFNSNWNLPPDGTLIDVLSHPYFEQAFNCGQKTIVLNYSNSESQLKKQKADFLAVETEMYEMAVFLLKKYKDRDVTFIIKNWEGDWIMRGLGKSKKEWMEEPAENRELIIENMTKWFEIRQKAITDARKAVKNSRANIFHAVECNKVIESMNGVDGIANRILPNIKVDIVSWSSYDGMNDYRDLYRGIQYLREQMQPTACMKGEKRVIIGEIGVPENVTKRTPTERWDEFFGVFFALDVPLIINWELYCNEPKDGTQNKNNVVRTAEDMRGFWMLKPDGSKSETALYWEKLMKNAGKKLIEN